jgi:hypothetical protein
MVLHTNWRWAYKLLRCIWLQLLEIMNVIFSHPVMYKRRNGRKGLEENKINWWSENQLLTHAVIFNLPFHLLFVVRDRKMCEKLIFLLLLFPILMFPFIQSFFFTSLFRFFSFPSLNIFCIQSRQNKRNSFCRWQHLHQSISNCFHTSRGGKRKVNFSIRRHKKATILIVQKNVTYLTRLSLLFKLETRKSFHSTIDNSSQL